MDSLISFEIVWQDDDLIQIGIVASNTRFSGFTKVYSSYDVLEEFANSIQGFPKKAEDRISFDFCKQDSFSSASFNFYCISGVGNSAAWIRMEANETDSYRKGEQQNVQLEVRFEALEVDLFVRGLKSIIENKSGKSTLKGIAPYTQNVD